MAIPSIPRRALAVAMSFLAAFNTITVLAEIELENTAGQTEESAGAEKDAQKKENPAPDVIKFKNQDILHGHMVSMSPAEGMQWTTPEVSKPIFFKMDHVASVDFGHIPIPDGDVDTAVSLTNGDILQGKLEELNAKKLVLRTGYAGILNIDRQMVSGIIPAKNGEGNMYRGPIALTDWVVTSNIDNKSASVKNGVMTLANRASVVRDMDLRKKALVEFHYQAIDSGQLRVILHQKGAKGRQGYYLVFSPGYVYLQKRVNNGSTSFGSSSVGALRLGKGKISIYTDLELGRIILYVDDKKVKQWSDGDFAEVGTFFGFASSNSRGTYKISQITIKPWNGKLPSKKTAKKDKSLDKDSVVFINKDQVSGNLKTIKDGLLVFATEYAELKIPMERVSRITLSGQKSRKARRNIGDAQLLLGNGCAITLNVASIDNDMVKGKSENFGEVNVKTKALQTIRFNIYSEDDE